MNGAVDVPELVRYGKEKGVRVGFGFWEARWIGR